MSSATATTKRRGLAFSSRQGDQGGPEGTPAPGRQPGRRLGYSQVVNSVYLARKGSYPWSHALRSIGRHLLANAVKSLRPEPEVDRWGRLQGNLRGLWHVLTGQAHPGRIVEM